MPQRESSAEQFDTKRPPEALTFVQAQSPTQPMVAPDGKITEQPPAPAHPAPAPPAQSPATMLEPDPQVLPQQQVRSVALEFTPDGGRDVRLRVIDRGGEVHVSLHSTDADLTGRLREGVQDLAGSLANAGYDADTWTPRDNGRQQHPESEHPTPGQRGRSRSGRSDEEFAGLFSNSVQETK